MRVSGKHLWILLAFVGITSWALAKAVKPAASTPQTGQIACDLSAADASKPDGTLVEGYYGGETALGSDKAYCLIYVSRNSTKLKLECVVTNLATGQKAGIHGSYTNGKKLASLTADKAYSDGKPIKDSKFAGVKFYALYSPDLASLTVRTDDDAESDFGEMDFITQSQSVLKTFVMGLEAQFKRTVFVPDANSEDKTARTPAAVEQTPSTLQPGSPAAKLATDAALPATGYYEGAFAFGSEPLVGVIHVSKDKSQFWIQGVVTTLTTGATITLQGRYSPNQRHATFTLLDGDGKVATTRIEGFYKPESRTFAIFLEPSHTPFADLPFITENRETLKQLLKRIEDAYHHTIALPIARQDNGTNLPVANSGGVTTPPAVVSPLSAVSTSQPVGSDSWALVKEEILSKTIDRRVNLPQLKGDLTGGVAYFAPHSFKEVLRAHDQHNDGTFYRSKDETFTVSWSPAPAVLKKGQTFTMVVQATADLPIVTNMDGVDGGWRWGPLTWVSGDSSNTEARHKGLWAGRDAGGIVPFCRYTETVRLDSAPDEFQFEEAVQSSVAGGKATVVRYTYRRMGVPMRANETWGGATFVARKGTTSYRKKGGDYQNLPNLDNVNGLAVGDRVKTGADGQIGLRTTSGAIVVVEPNSEVEITEGGFVKVISGNKTSVTAPGP